MQARMLHELLRAFYTHDEDYRLLHAFNHKPSDFSFDELLKKLGHSKK
jgi:hypothetical protein